MITEKGTLPIGIEKDGKWHRDFEIRPRLVKDTMEVAREQDMQRLEGDDIFFSLCLTAKQIIRIGDISPLPVDLLLEMYDLDIAEINIAKEKLAARLQSFHDPDAAGAQEGALAVSGSADTADEKADPGASQGESPVGSDPGNAG
jgi:hypothetical protein